MINVRCSYLPVMSNASVLLVFTVAAILSACAPLPTSEEADPVSKNEAQEAQPGADDPDMLYEWFGSGHTVSRILIDIEEQKAVFYDGPSQVGWSMIASGIPYFSTPKGNFAIREKVAEKRSSLYGRIYDSTGKLVIVNARRGVHRIPPGGKFQGAKMPYFMRLTKGGVGLHGGPIPEPGNPASHGCIRLPHDLARMLYESVRVGTPVQVVGHKSS